MQQQQSHQPRRAWGAPPPPKPAAEQRRGPADAAAGAGGQPPLPSASHAPPPKPGPPRCAYVGQPGEAGAHARRTWAHPVRSNRTKQQRAPGQGAAQPPPQPTHAPSASPSICLGLQSREDEDAVLIGSTAPSFSVPQQHTGPQPAPLHLGAALTALQQQSAARCQPADTSPPAGHWASASLLLSRRASLLSGQLDSQDMSLTMLAAASRRCTRYNSAGGSSRGSSSVSSSSGDQPEQSTLLPLIPSWMADGASDAASQPLAEPAEPFRTAPRSVHLSSSELALLRQSILELHLSLDAGCGEVASAQPDTSSVVQDIPDRVVLQELSRRLGRLDSQKRRVLLQVLAKIDGMPPSTEAAEATGVGPWAEGQASAEQSAARLLADSPGSSGQLPSGDPSGLDNVLPSTDQDRGAADQGSIQGRLAALKLGCISSGASNLCSASAAGELSSPQHPQPGYLDASVDRGMQLLVHGTHGQGQPDVQPARRSTRLQSMVRPRHRGRSRASLDGLHGGTEPATQISVPRPSVNGSKWSSSPSPDALYTFEQQHPQQGTTGLELGPSPSALVLGPWQQLPDALDAAAAATADGVVSVATNRGCSSGADGIFVIPCCPAGQVLELRISSTWGDQHYVGLSGIELFDSHGRLVTVRDPKRQVSASPHSINVLPEYGSDPRTPDKLLDGVCMTCDDSHVWLAPFTAGALHTVTVALDAAVSLGAVRLWNYNKSRIHSLRGARHVEIALDGNLIFRGELRQAPGTVSEALQHAELILFTEDPAALVAIEQHDRRYHQQLEASPPGCDGSSGGLLPALDLVTAGGMLGTLSARGELARRTTLPFPAGTSSSLESSPSLLALVSGGRPLTAAFSKAPDGTARTCTAAGAAGGATASALSDRQNSGLAASSRGSSNSGTASGTRSCTIRCKELALVILDSWGDGHFVGLSGLQVLGAGGQPLPIAADQLCADPPDLNVFPGHTGDVRTLDKLVDGTNNTMDDAHMWLAPIKRQLSSAVLAACRQQSASIDSAALPEPVRSYNALLIRLTGSSAVSGLRLWNYNKNVQDTARGVKRMLVLADGVEVSPPGGMLVRRAPGIAEFDFGQLVPLNTCWSLPPESTASPGVPGRRCTAQQPGARLAAGSTAATPAGGQHRQLAIQPEGTAWVCNLPDPAAALDFLQKAALLAKAAGPAGGLLHQPGECFATPLPCGFSLRLVLLNSWGCPHYIGLCGLEVRDAVRGLLPILPSQVFAVPSSVTLLPGMESDVRTVDKLVDGCNSGAAHHSWLAPLGRQQSNVVHVMLDAPVLLGSIRVWNYAKSPSRGVQELEVLLDEHLVWKGVLQQAPKEVQAGEDFSQLLCFSEDAMQEAAALAARRRVAAKKPGRQAGGGGGSAAKTGLTGGHLGLEGVQEWCHRQEAVVLVNNGQFVAFPRVEAGPAPVRPITSVVSGG